ncbi:MAG: mobile mystery protein B [Gammaproteobacteria bacterium]|nr:mobile mystery protein B [Gammaproteobacteria bacterium]
MGYPDGATPLDPDEMNGIKFPHITTRGQLDQMEHVNIQEGLRWLNRIQHTDMFTNQFVRKLHEKLFGNVWNWAGTFRQTEKNIGINPVQISQQLRVLLEDAQYWIKNKTYPPYELALRLHHRIMADAVLMQLLAKKSIDWKGDSLNSDSKIRNDYIAALRYADQGDYGPLLALYSKD